LRDALPAGGPGRNIGRERRVSHGSTRPFGALSTFGKDCPNCSTRLPKKRGPNAGFPGPDRGYGGFGDPRIGNRNPLGKRFPARLIQFKGPASRQTGRRPTPMTRLTLGNGNNSASSPGERRPCGQGATHTLLAETSGGGRKSKFPFSTNFKEPGGPRRFPAEAPWRTTRTAFFGKRRAPLCGIGRHLRRAAGSPCWGSRFWAFRIMGTPRGGKAHHQAGARFDLGRGRPSGARLPDWPRGGCSPTAAGVGEKGVLLPPARRRRGVYTPESL